MIIILGDLHLRADHPWFIEAVNHFLDWFEKWELNNPLNELVFLGDLVESPINGGIVVDFLERLEKCNRFFKLHIIVGNHDFKRIDKIYQLSYDFLKRKRNIVIYEKKTDVVIQGISCLMLPFLVPTIDIPSPYKYYSELSNNPKENFKRDVIFGHVQDGNFPGVSSVKNLEKLSDRICLGHIHVRVHKNYLGSIFPLDYSQKGQRYFRTYEKINDTIVEKEHNLPNFLEFKVIDYEEDIETGDALTSVYVINNCPHNNALIDSKYSSLHIRKHYKTISREDTFKKISKKSTAAYFKEFIKQSTPSLNRTTVKVCKEALKI